jgi:hypothetical protein
MIRLARAMNVEDQPLLLFEEAREDVEDLVHHEVP